MKALRWTLSLDTFPPAGEEFANVAAALRELADRLEPRDRSEGLLDAIVAHGMGSIEGSPMITGPATEEQAAAFAAVVKAHWDWKCFWKVEERE